jgi:hypothetical protein
MLLILSIPKIHALEFRTAITREGLPPVQANRLASQARGERDLVKQGYPKPVLPVLDVIQPMLTNDDKLPRLIRK